MCKSKFQYPRPDDLSFKVYYDHGDYRRAKQKLFNSKGAVIRFLLRMDALTEVSLCRICFGYDGHLRGNNFLLMCGYQLYRFQRWDGVKESPRRRGLLVEQYPRSFAWVRGDADGRALLEDYRGVLQFNGTTRQSIPAIDLGLEADVLGR